MNLQELLLRSDQAGVRLEIVNGLTIWEAQPLYRHQKLEIGPPFYLSQGVKDVLVFDPRTLLVLHVRPGMARRLISPVVIDLACGCRIEV